MYLLICFFSLSLSFDLCDSFGFDEIWAEKTTKLNIEENQRHTPNDTKYLSRYFFLRAFIWWSLQSPYGPCIYESCGVFGSSLLFFPFFFFSLSLCKFSCCFPSNRTKFFHFVTFFLSTFHLIPHHVCVVHIDNRQIVFGHWILSLLVLLVV